MNLVDPGIVLFALALGAVGYQRGLLASALPLAGFVGGAALGARVGPELLSGGEDSRYAALVAVVTGVLVGAFLAVALDGIAAAVHRRSMVAPLRFLDRWGGAALLLALGLLLAWAFGAVALHTTGENGREVREAVQRSAILAALNDVMPPSGPLLNVLRRVDPREFVRGPDADVPPPGAGIVEDADVVRAGSSAVRVLGTACGLGVAGSGWVAADDLVVTNAHVVAGQDDTTVSFEGGDSLEAEAVHYDPRNDLALLRVRGLAGEPLDLASRPRGGAEAAVAGYPENGPLTLTPARLGRTGTVTSQDSYGRGPVQRTMTPFRADVRSGNSGGPVVDAAGDVVATVFAASAGGGPPSGLGVPNGIVAEALAGPLDPTDTGPCAA
ncbi:MAG TPA: MarP family serine protease [Solirubrobacterales bacterium]|nr:MarP family serine protease [Solirubrobacterales bacterium]